MKYLWANKKVILYTQIAVTLLFYQYEYMFFKSFIDDIFPSSEHEQQQNIVLNMVKYVINLYRI